MEQLSLFDFKPKRWLKLSVSMRYEGRRFREVIGCWEAGCKSAEDGLVWGQEDGGSNPSIPTIAHGKH